MDAGNGKKKRPQPLWLVVVIKLEEVDVTLEIRREPLGICGLSLSRDINLGVNGLWRPACPGAGPVSPCASGPVGEDGPECCLWAPSARLAGLCFRAVLCRAAVSRERGGSCEAARTAGEDVAAVIHPLAPLGIALGTHGCAAGLDCATATFRPRGTEAGPSMGTAKMVAISCLAGFRWVFTCLYFAKFLSSV